MYLGTYLEDVVFMKRGQIPPPTYPPNTPFLIHFLVFAQEHNMEPSQCGMLNGQLCGGRGHCVEHDEQHK